MSQVSTEIPAGYKKNAQGALIPIDRIKPIDIERDCLVAEIVDKARELSKTIADFKHSTMGDIEAFVALSAEKYGAKLGGKVGNVTLTSFNGRYKVVRSIDEYQVFDERLQAAKALIDECITEWSAGSRSEIRTLINRAFQVDKAGRLNINSILSLRRLEITDERWQNAMKAIGESLQVVDSKAYIRIYERDADGRYNPLPLNVAA
ncbi:DUF3164 family protein [Geobacter pelophilus]|uniref:DUF3164 family protein n=1 Tax=Geoanaerobacter pelophilus TaxID=60036 RepID=A0AAW4L945_9BACT|nr:DUF3164 family protein [Geoanaerobacter pelophilus]MBT0666375.1 DUF3164 family protein [Geoanaerobacter pelophilus]